MANPSMSQIGAFIAPKAGTIPAANAAGTRNGSAIDRLGYNSAVLSMHTGATSGTPTSFTVDAKIQDSADGSTGWADYTPPKGSAAVTQITVASTLSEVNVDLSGAKRYIRVAEVTAFSGGTSPTIGGGSQVILGGADSAPV